MRNELLTIALVALSTAQEFGPVSTSIPQPTKSLSNDATKPKEIAQPTPHLNARDDSDDSDDEDDSSTKIVQTTQIFQAGKQCAHWKVQAVRDRRRRKRDHHQTVETVCDEWVPQEGDSLANVIYTTHTITSKHPCSAWKLSVDEQRNVEPYCADNEYNPLESLITKEEDSNIAARGVSRIIANPPPRPNHPPKGLLKEVQQTVHTLQSQLAQAQHVQYPTTHSFAALSNHDEAGKGKGKEKQIENPAAIEQINILRDLQGTVNGMQTRLAKAKFSIHAHFISSSKTSTENLSKGPVSEGLDQGVLQDLQHSVHILQTQLAKARHVVHAQHTTSGKKQQGAATAERLKGQDGGLDQGMLQGLQGSASRLQSQLSKARRALHAHLSKK